MTPYKVYKFKDGSQLELHQDYSPQSPREWDNLGTMACFHTRYDLGDEGHGIDQSDFSGWEAIEDHIDFENPDCVILPLYLYDHSGITIKTTPFSCPWDSGQIGFIFITRDKINEEYGNHGGRTDEEIEQFLRNEVAVYDQYLTGDIYGFILRDKPCEHCDDETGDELNSCWGFYGDNPIDNGIVDHLEEKYAKELAVLAG